jgi:hypothetical protein
MSEPISLSDLEVTTIMQCARPLPPDDRVKFVELVAGKLRGAKEIGPGVVWKACVEAQRSLFAPPEFNGGRPGVGKYA